MPRKPIACAVCGDLMQPGSTSLPEGQATHNRCRVTHGEARYRRHGCRCDVCKEAMAKCQRKFQKRYRERTGQAYRRNFPNYSGFWIHPVQRQVIYKRDNWTCQLCGEPVDSSLDSRTNRMAATLDHIVPRSKGGSDSPSNLQLAHRACNSAKKDSLEYVA